MAIDFLHGYISDRRDMPRREEHQRILATRE